MRSMTVCITKSAVVQWQFLTLKNDQFQLWQIAIKLSFCLEKQSKWSLDEGAGSSLYAQIWIKVTSQTQATAAKKQNAGDLPSTKPLIQIKLFWVLVLWRMRLRKRRSPHRIFTPIAVETVEESAVDFFQELWCRTANAAAEPRSSMFLMQCLSVAMQRGNAVCVDGTASSSSSLTAARSPNLNRFSDSPNLPILWQSGKLETDYHSTRSYGTRWSEWNHLPRVLPV